MYKSITTIRMSKSVYDFSFCHLLLLLILPTRHEKKLTFIRVLFLQFGADLFAYSRDHNTSYFKRTRVIEYNFFFAFYLRAS